MKKASLILTIIVLALAVLTGCKPSTETPVASPNVPIVSEAPAIPSPDLDASPMPDNDLDLTEDMEPTESTKPMESVKPTAAP